MRWCWPLLLLACQSDQGWMLADEIVFAPEEGVNFRDPQLAINGVAGAGEYAGSLDVYSLSHDEGEYLILGFSGRTLVDVDGPDLLVFENAFRVSDTEWFMDPTIVEASEDGTVFYPWPHEGPSEWSNNVEDWEGFAGIHPVFFDSVDFDNPFEMRAGGDAFELNDLPIDLEVRFIRLSSASIKSSPSSASYAHHPISNGPDIDGVAAAKVH